jgi:DNA helicase II / ATP-dependent DNA helicase PcrA
MTTVSRQITLDDLNPRQRIGVLARGHLMLSAGPGSGKTAVLSVRAASLLNERPDAHLAAVTFTNDAAQQLRDKILAQIPGASRRVQAGTFHKLCIKQLKAAGIHPKLMSTHQATATLQRLFDEHSASLEGKEFEEVRFEIEALKSRMYEWTPSPDDPVHLIYAGYELALKNQKLFDFADLVRETVFGMRNGTVQPLDAAFLLVDEFQDSDDAQLAWVLEHAHRGAHVTIVGDDDQSIYGWRGARGYGAMRNFLEETRAEHIILDTSYRCATSIIATANQLIEHNNPDRVDKLLRSGRPDRGSIRVVRYRTDVAEAEAIVKAVKESDDAGTWGILARSNRHLDVVEAAFSRASEPCKRAGKTPFWEQHGPALFLEAIGSLADGTLRGVDHLLSACGTRSEVIDRIHKVCDSGSPGALFRFIAMPVGASKIPDIVRVKDLQRWYASWLRIAFKDDAILVAGNGVAAWINTNVPKKVIGHADLGICAGSLASRRGSLQERLRLLQQQIVNSSGSGPELLTLHASKGLEWDHVWMVRCEEGVLPNAESNLAEERRLAYVGITRARSDLTLSFTRGIKKHPLVRSKFIDEAGLSVDLVERDHDLAAA